MYKAECRVVDVHQTSQSGVPGVIIRLSIRVRLTREDPSFPRDMKRVSGAGEVEYLHPEAEDFGEVAFRHHHPAVIHDEIKIAVAYEIPNTLIP